MSRARFSIELKRREICIPYRQYASSITSRNNAFTSGNNAFTSSGQCCRTAAQCPEMHELMQMSVNQLTAAETNSIVVRMQVIGTVHNESRSRDQDREGLRCCKSLHVYAVQGSVTNDDPFSRSEFGATPRNGRLKSSCKGPTESSYLR